MKKVFSLILILSFILGLSITVSAAEFKPQTDGGVIEAGENVTVTIILDEAISASAGVTMIQGELYYNADELTPVSVKASKEYSDLTCVISKRQPRVQFNWTSSSVTAKDFPAGTVVTVVFTTKKDIAKDHVKSELRLEMDLQKATGEVVLDTSSTTTVLFCKEHTWNSGVITTLPSCVDKGVKTYTCTYKGCGATRTEDVAATGEHVYGDCKVILEPTCIAEGIKVYTCGCGAKKEERIPATNSHNYSSKWTIDKEATCTEAGSKSHHCTVCDAKNKITPIPVKEHTYNEGAVVPKGAVSVKVFKCTACNASYEQLKEGYRISGGNRFETSFAIADAMKEYRGIDAFDTVIVASGINFADALSGSYLATVKNAPILITYGNNPTDLYTYIKENVKAGGTVYILGGNVAVSENVDKAVKKNGFTVKRLAGEHRFETNLMILEEAGVTSEDLLICTATNFADSLSASAANRPILLVGSSLMKEQKDFLKETTGKKYILGGEAAVNKNVEKAIGACTRLAGASRFETSVMIAETFFEKPEIVVFASALAFPDGLCGGPLAYALDAPLILTSNGGEAIAKAYVDNNGVKAGVVLGGTSAMSDATVKKALGKTVPVK